MSESQQAESRSGLLLSDDLMFTSRITGTARDLGFSIKTARNPDVLLGMAGEQPPACVVLDLANSGLVIDDFVKRLKEVVQPVPYIVAYGSHVDTRTLQAARAAGCDRVLARSQFVEELARALPEWFAQK